MSNRLTCDRMRQDVRPLKERVLARSASYIDVGERAVPYRIFQDHSFRPKRRTQEVLALEPGPEPLGRHG
jgi:hypothetical protein